MLKKRGRVGVRAIKGPDKEKQIKDFVVVVVVFAQKVKYPVDSHWNCLSGYSLMQKYHI